MLTAKFGNLVQPPHSEDPKKPEAKDKVDEMMQKLHDAGFKRVENTNKIDDEPKSYHVYSLPLQIEFSSDGEEAVKIMSPYSEYMKPITLVS